MPDASRRPNPKALRGGYIARRRDAGNGPVRIAPLTERTTGCEPGEHPFGVIKHLWGYSKVRYRGLAKNAAQVFTLFALANFYLARREWVAP